MPRRGDREPAGPLSLTVILRTCDRDARSRLLGLSKAEVIDGCLRSLLRTCVEAGREITVAVLDDHSEARTVASMEVLLRASGLPWQRRGIAESGNGASFAACLEFARDHVQDGLVYFVEDDYLHTPSAIREMLETFPLAARTLGVSGLVMHPTDHPRRAAHPEPCQVLPGSARDWRTVASTTCTFLLPRTVLLAHWANYWAFRRYGRRYAWWVCEASTINRTYRQVPCISPMPSLAVHFQGKRTLSPLVDWRAWWDEALRWP